MEQEDQQEAVALPTVVKKGKESQQCDRCLLESIFLVNSAFSSFSVGQKMLLIPRMKIFQKSIILYNCTK